MFTIMQRKILKMRRQHTQVEVAKLLKVSQANISKIEKTIHNKIKKAFLLLNELQTNGTILKLKFQSNPLQNAIFILPYVKQEYEVTGVSAQFLLTNYYEMANEIEIRTKSPFFSILWGSRIFSGSPGPSYLIKEGIRIASPSKILSDCLQRNDLAGIKSSIVMLINYKIEYSKFSNLCNTSMKNRYDEIISALNIILKEYNLEKKFQFQVFSTRKESNPYLLSITRKIVDDFVPFLEETTDEL